MKTAIADALESKKFLAFLVTIVVVVGNKCVGHFGYELDADQVALLVGTGAAYILGQGIADHGKTAADTNAAVAAAIAMEPGASKDAALKTLANNAGGAPIAPPARTSQAGFASPGVMLLIVSIGMALHLGCGASARQKTLFATLATLDGAETGLVAFDQKYQDGIVTACRNDSSCTEAIGHQRLVDYRAKRDEAVKAITAAYVVLGQAFSLDNDPSLKSAIAAAAVVATQLSTLGVTK